MMTLVQVDVRFVNLDTTMISFLIPSFFIMAVGSWLMADALEVLLASSSFCLVLVKKNILPPPVYASAI
jgi:hypothetical protein